MNTATGLHSVSVAGVITDDGRALLVRGRDTLHWEPPGGVLELDESIDAGLRREVSEETGLMIEPVAPPAYARTCHAASSPWSSAAT